MAKKRNIEIISIEKANSIITCAIPSLLFFSIKVNMRKGENWLPFATQHRNEITWNGINVDWISIEIYGSGFKLNKHNKQWWYNKLMKCEDEWNQNVKVQKLKYKMYNRYQIRNTYMNSNDISISESNKWMLHIFA